MPPLILPGKGPYFGAARREHLSQGDLFLSPSAILCAADDAQLTPVSLSLPPAVGQRVTVRAWGRPDLTGVAAASAAPAVAATVLWTPVIVLSHDCEIDKEFNEQVGRFLTAHPEAIEEDVIASYSGRWDLDRYVLVSPLLPYDEEVAPAWKHEGIRQAGRIGYFPVPPVDGYGGMEFLVHLARVSTVERRASAARSGWPRSIRPGSDRARRRPTRRPRPRRPR